MTLVIDCPPTESDVEWLQAQVSNLTDELEIVSPSEWAESNRYLPDSVTSMPGYYDYDVMPYLREIVDCMDVRCPVREVSLKKGAQVGWTTGVLENAIGYSIAVVKSAPCMFLTADAELAKIRMDAYIVPMIQQSGLTDCIQSSDELSTRKSAKTDKKVTWSGGGYLLPFGARNANKLRSFSIKFLFEDENDGFPEIVGKDGDPQKLAEARTKGYQQTRKILRGSTPLLKGSSKIDRSFQEGDQRYYNVACRGCGELQPLRFTGETEEGRRYGLTYDLDSDDKLVRGSVRYVCKFCGHEHKEADKHKLFAGGKWVPTVRAKSEFVRSYHLSSLYSPATMFSWADCVQSYLDAWDVVDNRPRDLGLLQEFYNNVLGESFEVRSNRLGFETVSKHRRPQYSMGHVPNRFAREFAGGPIGVVTCSVDCHKTHLDVQAAGWSPGKRHFHIDDFRFEGNCEEIDQEPWDQLRKLIEEKRYSDGEGRVYPIAVTFVDAGYNNDLVVNFCGEYERGVYPTLGVGSQSNARNVKEFAPFVTALGTTGLRIMVDLYKSRWSAALRREWDGLGQQPMGHFNAPMDITDQRLKELTTETKREVIDKETGQRKGWKWYRPSGARNELWDLLMYNSAALDFLAWDLMVNQRGFEAVDWRDFWDAVREPGLYFSED